MQLFVMRMCLVRVPFLGGLLYPLLPCVVLASHLFVQVGEVLDGLPVCIHLL